MLQVHQDGPVLRITFNRPEVRNAFDAETLAAFHRAFDEAPAACRVVVLKGAGKAFCSGGDLAAIERSVQAGLEHDAEEALTLARAYQKVAECPAVVIAAPHGATYGSGCGLVAAADVAIAADDARFAFSEVRLGFVPSAVSPFVLRKIGSGHARALFVTGEPFDAERAFRIGLVHQVVPVDQLDSAVESKVQAVLRCAPGAVAEAKRLAQQPPLPVEEAARLLALSRTQPEGREGIRAFLEKRPPSYSRKA